MEPQNSIELKNISKSFKLKHEKRNSIYEYITGLIKKNSVEELSVLNDVSFSVKKGQMLGVLGFNGSGKTTLLKIIAKIYQPDSGTVITSGKITPFLGLGVGFNGELTARDNIILYGTILGLPKKQINEKIDSIIKFAGLERFVDTKLKKFSSGMNARLAFSTAMEVDPDILLVDEVLSVGDISFRAKSFDKLLDFKRKGKTVVLVTHALKQIKENCDLVIWLHEGMIRQFGNPDYVVEEYFKFANKLKPENQRL